VSAESARRQEMAMFWRDCSKTTAQSKVHFKLGDASLRSRVAWDYQLRHERIQMLAPGSDWTPDYRR
jgi:VCBS repeat-containing protein